MRLNKVRGISSVLRLNEKADMILIFVLIYLTAGCFRTDGKMSFPGLENGLKRPPLANEAVVVKGMAPKAHPKVTLEYNVSPLYLDCIIALPTVRNSNEVARAQWLRCCPHTGNSGFLGMREVAGLVGRIRHPWKFK